MERIILFTLFVSYSILMEMIMMYLCMHSTNCGIDNDVLMHT